MANLSHGAVAVISHRFNQQRYAARTVALISDLFIAHPLFRASAATDSPIDRVVGHVPGLGIEDGFAQPRIGVGIAAAGAGCDGDFLDELGEEFAALGVSRALLVLNRMPLRMSGHLSLSVLKRNFCD